MCSKITYEQIFYDFSSFNKVRTIFDFLTVKIAIKFSNISSYYTRTGFATFLTL